MKYEVEFTRSAEREFEKLQRAVRDRLGRKFLKLESDPRKLPGVTKLSGAEDLYRLRDGDYRAIFQINDRTKTVTLTKIAHRRDIYR
ncbi:MAG TPA: type II toxin-antitoxin system RelE/ParE family toxin [Tepidisphaeraceae bacterium]|nr:type II toxin-antitoxin system RelE/ParE family toxin [Tepidisphaeraceae bacterium]